MNGRRVDSSGVSLVRQLARRVAQLEHVVDLLADHFGVSVEELRAWDEVSRRGEHVVDWDVIQAAGLDPTTREPRSQR